MDKQFYSNELFCLFYFELYIYNVFFKKNTYFYLQITNYLLSLENPSLGLQPLPFSGKSVAVFDQENISLTRKFVLPAMQNYLKCVDSGT